MLIVRDQKTQDVEINCFKCQYFYITHDGRFPYGCKAAGFKSRMMPSKEMYVNSGIECQVFQKKDERQ